MTFFGAFCLTASRSVALNQEKNISAPEFKTSWPFFTKETTTFYSLFFLTFWHFYFL
jgi:hypothetical protein